MNILEQFDFVWNEIVGKVESEPSDEDCVREGKRVEENDGENGYD